MQLTLDHRAIVLVDEPTYTFGSVDNARLYPFAKNLAHPDRPSSIHGVLLSSELLAVLGASGGATGVHEQSALLIDNHLFVAVGDSVACMSISPFQFLWSLQVDVATCFGLYLHALSGALISHGELSISRFTPDGKLLWQSYGEDIFAEPIVLANEYLTATDFNHSKYNFWYCDGKNAA